jgi:hypothetical protein
VVKSFTKGLSTIIQRYEGDISLPTMYCSHISHQYSQMKIDEITVRPEFISSTTPRELWVHPTLDLFTSPAQSYQPQKPLLFTTPSSFGEIFDEDDRPQPTPSSALPNIQQWSASLAISALEVFAGRRNPAQLAMRCHRVVYNDLLTSAGMSKEIGKIIKIHQVFPLDGVAESSITVQFKERMRAMVMRAEGIDGRWLCTALELI